MAALGFFLGAMIVFACSGCSVRGDSGRLLGMDVGIGLSVGENTSAMTTAGDKTKAGEQVTRHRPTAEAVTSSGRRGFQGLEVNHE